MKPARNVLITGGALRIGKAIALCLAKAGWDIAIHYNNSEKPAAELAKAIRAMGHKAYLVKANLLDAKAVARIFPALKAKGIMPDCLINNAAIFTKDTLADLAPDGFHSHINTNLLAPLILMRDFAEHYKGTSGNIINITDGLKGWSMSPAFLSYTLSKQALNDVTRMLAVELAPKIRVNAVAPGATLPGKQDKKDTFAKLKKITPLACVSSPKEICDAVQYIFSSPSLTGQILRLGGGLDLV